MEEKKRNIRTKPTETPMDYQDAVYIMTPKLRAAVIEKLRKDFCESENCSAGDKHFPQKSGNSFKRHKINHINTCSSTAEDRSHLLNEILEWLKISEMKWGKRSERMPLIMTSQKWHELQKSNKRKKQEEA